MPCGPSTSGRHGRSTTRRCRRAAWSTIRGSASRPTPAASCARRGTRGRARARSEDEVSAAAQLGHVMVRTDADPLLSRLRASSHLGAADWDAPGLGAAAVLVIRRLRDPLPYTLDLEAPFPSL